MVSDFGIKDNMNFLETLIKTIEVSPEKHVSYEAFNFNML